MSDKPILSDIFERSLALDQKSEKKSRVLNLFERMAKRLDEIAPNTRGLSGVAAMATRAKNKTVIGSSTASTARGSATVEAAAGRKNRSAVSNVARELERGLIASARRSKAAASVTSSHARASEDKVKVEVETPGAGKKSSGSKTATTQTDGNKAEPTRSQTALVQSKQRKQDEKSGKKIADAILSGISKIGGIAKSGMDAVAQNSDAKDAVGYAAGGPVYGVLKELRDAVPDFSKLNLSERKEREDDNKKVIKAIKESGKQRDDKGRFVKPDQNQARREVAQTEAIEAQLAFEEGEAKKEEKRHKELVRAVKNNKRGLLDRFLDRRALGGSRGRDRVVRERTVTAKSARYSSSGGRIDSRGRLRGGERGRGGILSRAGNIARGAGKTATGALAMGGKAMGGLLRALPGIGQMIALGMAAYDGFQGWNDKELHKQAFGLKDGQEASTGQKASAAAASILDMGGLTTGLLGMLGIEFDKAGVTRSIYEFGSNIGAMATSVINTAMPLLQNAWKGIEDFGGKIWAGAKDIGSSIANFATGIWDKGVAFATSIGSWAEGAISEGVGIVTGIWGEAKNAVSGCWASLAGFASESIKKGGAILSSLWEGAKELPGKIVEGAKDLAAGVKDVAVSAYEGGKSLLSKGWKWMFGEGEAQAAETPPKTDTPQPKESVALSVEPEKKSEPAEKTPFADTPANFTPETKLLPDTQVEDLSQSRTSSEAAAGAEVIEQAARQKALQEVFSSMKENLEEITDHTKGIKKLLDDEFREDLTDEYGIAGAMGSVANAISNIRGSGGGYLGGYAGVTSGSSSYAPTVTYSGLGDVVMKSETGGKGTAMISSGLGDKGGVSYGRSQLASKINGSIDRALNWAKSNGYEDIYNELAPLVGDATNRNGQFAQKWAQLASDKSGRLEAFDRAYQKQGYFDPMMAKIRKENPELAKRIEANPAMQEQVLSTSVQYGQNSSRYLSAANEALAKNANISDRELIAAIQDIKARDVGINFKGSSANVQRGVVNRHGGHEKKALLAIQDRFERGDIQIDKSTGTGKAVVSPSLNGKLIAGGNDAVSAGSSAMIAAATQEAINKHVGYNMGSKNSASGEIDCSGWVAEVNRHLMADMNAAIGEEVFNKDARKTLSKGAEGGAAGIIQAVGQKTGKIYNNAELAPENVREGMAIGLSLGNHAKGRFRDIGHIVQTYRDPETGEIMVSESVSKARGTGERGVVKTSYSDWYKKYGNVQMHGVDMMALADASKVKAAQATAAQTQKAPPQMQSQEAATIAAEVRSVEAATQVAQIQNMTKSQAVATAAHSQTAPQPKSMAENAAAQVAAPTREPEKVESIRQIDPAREIKTQSNDNGMLLAVLQQILLAINDGNQKLGALSKLAGQNGNSGPSIRTDYDDPAIQGMAADSA